MLHKAEEFAQGISSFLVNWLRERADFSCRSFYGETFSLALLSRSGVLSDKLRSKLLRAYEAKDKSDPEFHWEFNNYALLDYCSHADDPDARAFLLSLKFKDTPCTNWTLLRSNCRLNAKVDEEKARDEAREKLVKMQLPSGLILDDPGVKSFQYHCFSAAMIAEIYEHTADRFFYEAFLRSAEFIKHFILRNGETLYIGRGQKQSFGYGALAYVLALAHRYTGEDVWLGDLQRVLGYLARYERPEKNFPLMMNGVEKHIPEVIDMQNPEFSGWYPYNNYFDYLPFMGFFLQKTAELLCDVSMDEIFDGHPSRDYRDDDFIRIYRPNYDAVISRPGGYWTNDMPVPYVVTDTGACSPCYGGEQFQKSLYREQGIPIPFFPQLKRSLRWRAASYLRGNVLWMISPLGWMKRTFVFEEDGVEVHSWVGSPFSEEQAWLFLEPPDDVSVSHLRFSGVEYSADGSLYRYVDKRWKSTIKLKGVVDG